MDLIPSFTLFNVLASIPLVMMFVSVFKPIAQSIITNPLTRAVLNTTLVVLESTEVVWRPLLNLTLMVIKPIYKTLVALLPQIKAVIVSTVNMTIALVKNMQAMGLSISQAVSATLERMGEFGDALVILARTFTKAVFYTVRMLSSILGAFEEVFNFGKKAFFDPAHITMNDLYNVMLPFIVVSCCIGLVLWVKRASVGVKSVPVYQPRRSSRLARKRAMLLADNLSDSLPPCKKTSATSADL
jgi:hypothetical protein